MSDRIMVVANRTCPCAYLLDVVAEKAMSGDDVLVISPALNSRLRHFVSDSDGARTEARERLDTAIAGLEERGVSADGEVGDADPLVAMQDAHVGGFDATRIIIATWPEGKSHWLAKDLLPRTRERFDVPVDHVVSAFAAPA